MPDEGRRRRDDRRRASTGRRCFPAVGARPPPTVTVRLLAQVPPADRNATILVVGLTIGFLALAFVFAVIVSRDAVRPRSSGCCTPPSGSGAATSASSVPAEGNDEFAALGKEFNSMALQLEARLEDLRRERGRLQEAIRRVGESFARGLDRVGVLEIVVQTAVDGVGAACGRATMRRRADAPMEEVARTGEPEAFHRALHAAEAAVMDAGEVAEIQTRRGERAGRAAVGHRGRRPRARDRLRRPRRPPLHARRSASCSPT